MKTIEKQQKKKIKPLFSFDNYLKIYSLYETSKLIYYLKDFLKNGF